MLLLYNPRVALLLFLSQYSHCSVRTLNLQHTLPFHPASSLGVKGLAPMLTFKVTQAGTILGGLLKKKVSNFYSSHFTPSLLLILSLLLSSYWFTFDPAQSSLVVLHFLPPQEHSPTLQALLWQRAAVAVQTACFPDLREVAQGTARLCTGCSYFTNVCNRVCTGIQKHALYAGRQEGDYHWHWKSV